MFEQVRNFDAGQSDAVNQRKNLITSIIHHYNQTFDALHQFISYSMSQTIDFTRLEGQGRAAVQAVQDQSTALVNSLEEQGQQAAHILQEVRRVAAEQGVTQQAVYFKAESEEHDRY